MNITSVTTQDELALAVVKTESELQRVYAIPTKDMTGAEKAAHEICKIRACKAYNRAYDALSAVLK